MSGGHVPTAYQPSGSRQVDTQAQGLFNATTPYIQALPGQTIPQAQSLASNEINNPYSGQAQAGAGQVAGLGQGVGLGQLNTGQGLTSAASQILQTGFDPQQALYNRTFQQLTQQQNAINAMNGVSGTPYGASLTGDQAANFNIDWQNAQLARQLAALGGAGQADTTGSNLESQGLDTLATSSALPRETYAQDIGQKLGALNTSTGVANAALAPSFNQETALDNYLKVGQSATQINQDAAKLQNQLDSQLWKGIGDLFGIAMAPFTGGTSLFAMAPSVAAQASTTVPY